MCEKKASLSGIFGFIFFGLLALTFFFLDMVAIAREEVDLSKEVPFLLSAALGTLAYMALKLDKYGA